MGDDPLLGDGIRVRPGPVRAGMLSADTVNRIRLRERVMNILQSEACRSIAFRVDNISIQHFMYLYIATAVQSGNVGIDVGFSKSKYPIDPSAAAAYEPVENIMYFRSYEAGRDAEGEGSIVHEATHAVVDATFGGGGSPPAGAATPTILTTSNELAAYLAQTLYALYRGQKSLYVDNPFNQKLWALAVKIKDNNTNNPATPFVCPPADTAALKAMLAFTYKKWNPNSWIDGIGDRG